MTVKLDAIKALREKTGASIQDIRKALESSCGDEAKAIEWLRQRGVQLAGKRQGRATGEGRVESYVHHDGRLAAIVEVNCESDFVARTDEFIQFCRDIAMHVAAMDPKYIREEDARKGEASPKEFCLLQQLFVKDQDITVGGLLQALIAKTGENIVIRRFSRFALGESGVVA